MVLLLTSALCEDFFLLFVRTFFCYCTIPVLLTFANRVLKDLEDTLYTLCCLAPYQRRACITRALPPCFDQRFQ